MGFAKILDDKLSEIAQQFQVPYYWVRATCLLQRKQKTTEAYWQRHNTLYRQMGRNSMMCSKRLYTQWKTPTEAIPWLKI